MEGIPTIPCALIFSLHVQQLEQGGFTLANGMYRWPKLRSLAKLVDLIRICKNSTFKFVSDPLLKEQLQNRISDMHTHNLETLVWTSSDDNKSGTSSSSRWSTVLKKMKGKFA
ncbi:KNDC1 [Bugula neritina]|nr:KNDC1 [Bugula neritina]